MPQYSQDPLSEAMYSIGFNLLGGRKRAAKFADEEAEKELRRQARMEELKAAVDARYRMELERYVQEQAMERAKYAQNREDYRAHAQRGALLEEQQMRNEGAMDRTQRAIDARAAAAAAEREDPYYIYKTITQGLGPIGNALNAAPDKELERGLLGLAKYGFKQAGISYDEPAGPTATKAPARIPMSSVTKSGETPANGQAQPPLPVTPAPKPPTATPGLPYNDNIIADIIRRIADRKNPIQPATP